MANTEGARPEEDTLTIETLIRAFREVKRTGQAPPGDRHRLKPPTFGGDENIEQFIREFKVVVTITE